MSFDCPQKIVVACNQRRWGYSTPVKDFQPCSWKRVLGSSLWTPKIDMVGRQLFLLSNTCNPSGMGDFPILTLEYPGASRGRQGVEGAKTLVISADSIKTFRAIKYLAIDHTKKWRIRKSCKIRSRFTSRSLIRNAVKISQSAVGNRWKPPFFHTFFAAIW